MTFSDLGQVPFASQTTVSVDVARGAGRGEQDEQLGRSTRSSSRCRSNAVHVSGNVAAAHRRRRRRARGRRGSPLAWVAWVRVRRLRDAQRDADRRRPEGPGRVRGLAPGPHRRPAPRRRRDRRRASRASTAASTTSVTNTAIVRYDAYEDTGGHQSASLALLDAARTRHRRHRDPGPRLRAHLHEGARPRQAVGRALARGAGGRRARDGALSSRRASETASGSGTFRARCSRFSS